jgi:hypothetical protein
LVILVFTDLLNRSNSYGKKPSESIQKFLEDEVCIDLALTTLRQLIEYLLVYLVVEEVITVVNPFEVEELNDIFHMVFL